MIDSISIAKIATYGDTPEVIGGLSKFNFFFGSNGTGKTTLSRVIADDTVPSHSNCSVVWKGGMRLQTMVYNRDFITKNFNSSTELKGVFTLGEKNSDTLNKIEAAKNDISAYNARLVALNISLNGEGETGGKLAELQALEAELQSKCWEQKTKHDTIFSDAFQGLRNNKENFKTEILKQRKTNSATLESLENLTKLAATVFGQSQTSEKEIVLIDTSSIVAHESNPVLKKKVIGKDNVDIAAMITKLGNSDWVRTGRDFYTLNEDKVCPFCQQRTSEYLAQSLNEYFDETFAIDSKAIDGLDTNYKADADRLLQKISLILDTPTKFLDVEKLKTHKSQLDSKITINIQRLSEKKKEPSRSLELESLTSIIDTIKKIVEEANKQIIEYNKLVSNLPKERRDLIAKVWRYLLDVELKSELASYESKYVILKKSIDGIQGQIQTISTYKTTKTDELKLLEKQITSIQPTIDGINALLASFGFRSFSLAKAENGAFYKLLRQDGTDAKDTLSEGEKTFVTFLYFYHSLKGSYVDSGITSDRVVVFDDPVSSLDSDILFIVGSLIKSLFDEVREGKGHIKQIFVFTHNVYFHKEVTFNTKRSGDAAMKEETFWIIRRPELESKIMAHTSNPIKTLYELLWLEVRNPNRSKLSIQNTLRRILENYFRILGGIDSKDICNKFEGKEKLICNSLFGWINDGSHYAHDDLYLAIDDSTITTYLNVFRDIFTKLGHHSHYKMMMGNAYVESAIAAKAD